VRLIDTPGVVPGVSLPDDVTTDFARLIDVLVQGEEVQLEATVRRIDDEDCSIGCRFRQQYIAQRARQTPEQERAYREELKFGNHD